MSLSLPVLLVASSATLLAVGMPCFGAFAGLFVLDGWGVYLCLVSLIFLLSLVCVGWGEVSGLEALCLAASAGSSLVCFLCDHFLLFWISYELTIIPLLFALFCGSPYSERFLAGWYLLCYILLTGVPLLLVLLLLSQEGGSMFISFVAQKSGVSFLVFIIFATKVPLPPFHSWLPVVHAEASTFVSVALSGYVMKLGILGFFRFCGGVWEEWAPLLLALLFVSLLFFLSSSSELDVKRWLAFLSLSHIVLGVLGVGFSSPLNHGFSSLFCLGHGVSAGLLFFIFLVFYRVTGSRNWYILSESFGSSNLWKTLLVISLLTVSSFPPSMSFFSEVLILANLSHSSVAISGLQAYLFFGGLVPLVLLGYLLVNTGMGGTVSFSSGCVVATTVVVLFVVWLLGGWFA